MSMYLLMCGVILLHLTAVNFIFRAEDMETFKEYIIQDFASMFVVYIIWVFNRKGYTFWTAIIFISFSIITPAILFKPDDLEATMVILALPIMASSFVISPTASFFFAFLASLGYTLSILFYDMFYLYNFTSIITLFGISFAAFITAWQFNRSLEKNETLLRELEQSYETTLDSWSRALDMRDKETEGHTQRVAELTLQTAQKMGFSKEELIHMRRGALLHDIGKLGVPDSILLKPGPLTDEETSFMRKHTQFAYELIYPIEYLRPALDIPTTHHEKWDGTGYPRGLKGEQIPLAARIFAIADVYDALTSDRPYRAAWSKEKAIQYIKEQSGSHFDPQIVPIFLQEIEKL
ncbi:MAG: HD-GYP domain-containing protein [Anaerolineales bacterium]